MLQASWPWYKQEWLPQTICTARLEPASKAPRTWKTAPKAVTARQDRLGRTSSNREICSTMGREEKGHVMFTAHNINIARKKKKLCCFQSIEKKSVKQIITASVGFQPHKANKIFPFHVHVLFISKRRKTIPLNKKINWYSSQYQASFSATHKNQILVYCTTGMHWQ